MCVMITSSNMSCLFLEDEKTKNKEGKMIGVVGGNGETSRITPEAFEKPFAMFSSPETKFEQKAEGRSPGENEEEEGYKTKKLTLMLARPLKYFQMGKYMAHIDAGNPALIVPSEKNDGTYEAHNVYPPFAGRYNTKLIPIYNKNGKKIANVNFEAALKRYQSDVHNEAHNRRSNIPHHVEINQTSFLSEIAAMLNFDHFEGDKILDSSGHGNDGLMSGAATLMHANYSCGMACWLSGGVITFDGSRFKPKPSTAISIATWMKLGSTSGVQSVFSTVGFSHNDGQFLLEVNDGKLIWKHTNEQQYVVFDCETSDIVIQPDQWVHVTATYDSAERKWEYIHLLVSIIVDVNV